MQLRDAPTTHVPPPLHLSARCSLPDAHDAPAPQAVPGAAEAVPQRWLPSQVETTHGDPTGVPQFAGTRHCTHAPAPSHTCPPPVEHAAPGSRGGVLGVVPVHFACLHGFALAGR